MTGKNRHHFLCLKCDGEARVVATYKVYEDSDYYEYDVRCAKCNFISKAGSNFRIMASDITGDVITVGMVGVDKIKGVRIWREKLRLWCLW